MSQDPSDGMLLEIYKAVAALVPRNAEVEDGFSKFTTREDLKVVLAKKFKTSEYTIGKHLQTLEKIGVYTKKQGGMGKPWRRYLKLHAEKEVVKHSSPTRATRGSGNKKKSTAKRSSAKRKTSSTTRKKRSTAKRTGAKRKTSSSIKKRSTAKRTSHKTRTVPSTRDKLNQIYDTLVDQLEGQETTIHEQKATIADRDQTIETLTAEKAELEAELQKAREDALVIPERLERWLQK